MKIKIAVEAKVSADRKRCLPSCPWVLQWHTDRENPEILPACTAYGFGCLKLDHLGRPLRCRACIRNEVRP